MKKRVKDEINIEVEMEEIKRNVTLMAILSSHNHESDLRVRVKSGLKDMLPMNKGFLKETNIDPVEFGYFYSDTYLACNSTGFGRCNKNDWRALNLFYIIDITGEEPNINEIKKNNLYVIPYIEFEFLNRKIHDTLHCNCAFLIGVFTSYMNDSLKDDIKKRDKSDTDQEYNIPYESIKWIINTANQYTTWYNNNSNDPSVIEDLNKRFSVHCDNVAKRFEEGNSK